MIFGVVKNIQKTFKHIYCFKIKIFIYLNVVKIKTSQATALKDFEVATLIKKIKINDYQRTKKMFKYALKIISRNLAFVVCTTVITVLQAFIHAYFITKCF